MPLPARPTGLLLLLYAIADLGYPITRSSTIQDLGDVQIDLSRKYHGALRLMDIDIGDISSPLLNLKRFVAVQRSKGNITSMMSGRLDLMTMAFRSGVILLLCRMSHFKKTELGRKRLHSMFSINNKINIYNKE